MSISRNVGALSGYLSSMRFDPYYQKAKADFEALAALVPPGLSLLGTVDRLKQGVKHLILPGNAVRGTRVLLPRSR